MIAQAFIIAMLVLCISYALQEGEIFGWLGGWFEKHLPYQIHPVVFDCNVCMCPWYGSILYWIIYHDNVKGWLLVVFAAMGINIVINKLSPDK